MSSEFLDEVSVTHEQRERIEWAARILGETVIQFVRLAALDRADYVIRKRAEFAEGKDHLEVYPP